MTDGTRWPANIAGQPWAHVTDVSATKKTPQTHGIAAYRSLHSNPTPPLHQGPGVPGVVRGHQICSLATAGHRGAEMLSDAVSQVATAGRRDDVVSRFDGESSLHNP